MKSMLMALFCLFSVGALAAPQCNVGATKMEAEDMTVLPDGSTMVTLPSFSIQGKIYRPIADNGVKQSDYNGLCHLLGFNTWMGVLTSHSSCDQENMAQGFMVGKAGNIEQVYPITDTSCRYYEAIQSISCQ